MAALQHFSQGAADLQHFSHGAADLQHFSHGAADLQHSSHVAVVSQHSIHVAKFLPSYQYLAAVLPPGSKDLIILQLCSYVAFFTFYLSNINVSTEQYVKILWLHYTKKSVLIHS